MKKLLKNESGRTVAETVAVLAIIGLLTVGGVAGYTYLLKQERRQETAKEVAQLVTSIRTTGMARQYAEAETIPAREVVKGPAMVDNGLVMKLPDGEESYAVVTTLNEGAFAVALQMEKGTCSAVLDALGAQPASMFEVKSDGTKLTANGLKKYNESFVQGTVSGKINADQGATAPGGVRMNVSLDTMAGDSAEERAVAKERLAAMKTSCQETGRAAIVFDCPGGSSGYSHVYGIYCNQCPQGMLRDANGECCAAYACGNLCACPGGTMCDTEKNACVLCSTNGPKGQSGGNEQCWAVYQNSFAQHVCNGENNTCIECLTNLDCKSSIGPQNPYGRDEAGNYTHVFCEGHKCVECTVNYGETSGIPCATIGKPLCHGGACEPCPVGMIFDPDSKRCVCETGVLHPTTQQCVFCYDSARGNATDAGCGEGEYVGKPICTEVGGTNSFGVGGTNSVGTTCYECVIDANCNSSEYCDQETHTCKSCEDGKIWDGTACRLCQDNRSGAVTDIGCSEGCANLCEPLSGHGNGTGEYGDACRVCRNNNYGNNQDNKDDGCTDNDKLCDADDEAYGMECYKCRDDHSGATRDSGCTTENPICLKSGAFDATRVTNLYGTRCVVCVNDKSAYGTDTGCTDDKPMCNGVTGEAGTQCSACPDGQIWNDILNNGCTVCYDSQTGARTDAGCGAGTWAGKPICATPNNTNNGQGTSGNSCAVCQNDKTEGVDTGCSDNQPLCNAAQGAFGTACTACPSGQIWNGKICAVCFDTATGANTDNGCGSGTWAGKPICGTTANNGEGTAGTSCYSCYDSASGDGQDAGCTTDRPVCATTNGKFGNACEKPCSGNDKCVDAAGVSGTVGACIPVNSYDDIKRGSDGKCECLAAVKTQTVSDTGHSYSGEIDFHYNCDRLTTARKRRYQIPVNFYCARYMHVSDDAKADDFVYSSSPSGIGANSQHDSWGEAHDNSISPRVSSGTIQRGTAELIVSDRWAAEVGLNGYFYFTTKKKTNADGAVKKLTVTAGWNPGSSQQSPTTGLRCKEGEGSTAKKNATGDAHCCR